MPRSGRILIIGLLISLLGLFAMATPVGATTQPKVTLEQAIQIVRQNFDVPVEFSEFSSSLNEYGSGKVWYLSWNRPDKTGGNFSAQVDSATGEIISMNRWQPQVGGASRIPIISWNEAVHRSARRKGSVAGYYPGCTQLWRVCSGRRGWYLPTRPISKLPTNL